MWRGSINLLKESVKTKVLALASRGFRELSEAIKKRSDVLSDEIIMLAGALNYFVEDESRVSKLGHALELALDAAVDVKHNAVNYNELITHWIMEGHLDHANCMEKAYLMGHDILMELIDRGMLRMEEDNMIALEAATLKMNECDNHCRKFSRLANLGLASILKDEERKVFERIIPGDRKSLKHSFRKSRTSKFLPFLIRDSKKYLPFLIRDSKTFPFSNSKMEKLLVLVLVLVLRGSYLLEDCSHIAKLKALTVLEISDATYLEEIPDGLFNEVPQLRSLNLPGLAIKLLPSSVSNLTALRRFILRQCSCLVELPRLNKLEKLEVLDLSQCTSLTKIQNKRFNSQLKLQVLDFSGTKIEKPPIVKFLKDLTQISLKGCKCLTLLCSLKGLSSLKIVDLSGAVMIEEINDNFFEGTNNLKVLYLSYAKIQCLPSCIGNPCDLRLKGCSSLENFPSTTALINLESLDLSNATSLTEIQDKSFEHLLESLLS
ncbi:hypothetical protein DITRI_Ditri20bG0040000 [Diplodiscus trichospermus]